MLSVDCWESDYSLSLELHNTKAKSAYCILNHTSLSNCMEAILKNASSVLHTVQVYSLKIKHYNDKRMFQDSLDTAICILNKIGENINYSHSEAITYLEAVKASDLLCTQSQHHEISEMKQMEDEYKLATMAILHDILPSLYFIKPQLYFYISLRMVHLTLEYGVSKYSSLGFCALGSALISKGSKMDIFPYHLGKLSITLLKQVKMKEFVPSVYIFFYGFINPFYASIHDSIDPYLYTYKVSLEIGNRQGAIASASTYCTCAFLSGKNLEKVKDYIIDIGDKLVIKIKPYLAMHQAILNLLGENECNPALLSGQVFDYKSIDINTVQGSDGGRIFLYCCMVRLI